MTLPTWFEFFAGLFADLQKGPMAGITPYDPVTPESLDAVIGELRAKQDALFPKERSHETVDR